MKIVKVGTIVKHLKELGIECKYSSGSFVALYWRGEDVGTIYERDGAGKYPVVRINADLEYAEAKRKRVADVRKYFDQRKTAAATRDAEIKTGLPMHSPIFTS